jgi:hypothetical protein
MNEQMDPAEVLAIAVRQYEGAGLRTLVPQVFGQTAGAQARKAGGPSSGREWDEGSFFAALQQRGDTAYRIGRQIYEWCSQNLPEERWGKGATNGSCSRSRTILGVRYAPFALWTTGDIELLFRQIKEQPPFDREEMRRELERRLATIPGVSLPPNALNRQPSIKMTMLGDSAVRTLLDVFGWYLAVAEEHFGADPA